MITILGKYKNWNPEAKCNSCKKSLGNNDYWSIEKTSFLNKKVLLLFCEECYSKEYGIYQNQEVKKFIPNDYVEYSKFTVADRNLLLFKIFPKEFWNDLKTEEKEVLFLFDFLLDGDSNIALLSQNKIPKERFTEITNRIDEYTQEAEKGSFSDKFKVGKTSIKGKKVIFYDSIFLKRQSEIIRGELLTLGFKMLNALTNERRKELSKKIIVDDFENKELQKNLEIWADITTTALLEQESVFKKTIHPTMSFMVVERIGLLKYLHWLRKFQLNSDLTKLAETFYPSLMQFK